MTQAVNQYGDLLPPGNGSVAEVKPSEILASYARFTQKGVTLAQVDGGGLIEAGTVLGRVTATKKYVPYDSSASDGSEVARGVLRQSADTTTGDKLGNIVYSGILKLSLLIGLDGDAIAELNGRTDEDVDWFTF